MPDAPYTGLYINLDRSTDRRAALESQLNERQIGHLYQRLPATDGDTLPPAPPLTRGEVGCLRSHIEALSRAAVSEAPTHIVEDDILISRDFAQSAARLIESGLLDRFDFVFTDTFVHANVMPISLFRAAFTEVQSGKAEYKILDLAGHGMAGATSYFVSPRGAQRALAVIAQEIKGPPRAPYDLYLRKFADERRLRLACVAPFLTSIRLEDVDRSTIGRRAENAQVHALLRYSFYKDRDLTAVQPQLDALTAPLRATSDPHRAFAVQILDYVLAGRGEAF